MKIREGLNNRILIFSVLLGLQATLLLLVVLGIVTYAPIMTLGAKILSGIVMLFILNKEEEAGYKITWVIVILLLPMLGGIVYLVIGNKQPSKYMRKRFEKQMKHEELYRETTGAINEIQDTYIQSQFRYLDNEGFVAYKNNKTTYYPLGDDNFVDVLKALKSAKHFIFMEYFIVEEGEMFNQILYILKQKVKEGVEVRFMYDDVGSLTMLPHKYYMTLEEYGIKCITFNPFIPILSVAINHRDHRKITVVDGWVGFTGGMNLADEYINVKMKYGHWKDTGVKIEGNSVWNLTTMFLTTWNASKDTVEDFDKYHPRHYQPQSFEEKGYVIPYGDSPLDNRPVGQNVYLNIINQAKRYVYICTPYLIINETLQTALVLAKQRGVDVRICTPGIPDKKLVFRVTRSYYEDLIRHGIRIYEYTPGFLHAKNFVCDDEVATVGTINMDYRSLFLHFECGLYMYQTETIQSIKDDFLHTIEVSEEMTKEKVIKGRFKGIYEAILRLFAPLL
ncbi:MAG: cardiolipin synthase [Coprobacillaceae bacterium]